MGWFEEWSGMVGGTEDAGLRHGGGERGEGFNLQNKYFPLLRTHHSVQYTYTSFHYVPLVNIWQD